MKMQQVLRPTCKPSFGATLTERAVRSADAVTDKKNSVKDLIEIFKAKRAFKAGYNPRVYGKNDASMKTSELRRHKVSETTVPQWLGEVTTAESEAYYGFNATI